MTNSSQEHAIGIPFRSVGGKSSLHEPIVAYARTTQYGTSQLKQSNDQISTKFAEGAESIIGLVNRFKRKADNLAQGIRDHVSLGPGVSETVKAKLKLGTRILQAGGIERVFKKSFSIGEGEKLVKAFQCHLSTTVGPIPGLLFISTEKIAFLSDRSLVIRSPRGNIVRTPYKVLIPLRRIKGVNPSENADKPNQKYIHIATIDNFEFWFMGFVSYQRSFKNLQRAIFSKSQISFLQ
ncbi:GEM-like protein 6 [Dendrobium catenatum]|uniref:GEM-like protein 6 n=1 Tax=Dendrobium catenatum TaxID=906689 RepID=A0A2I0XIS1_9ASPA|nr:GEM-like protein 6 [Dendrobium catenatum]